MVEVAEPTLTRVRKRFVTAGLAAALHRKHPERDWPRKLDGTQEAHLMALACSDAPDGREACSLRLLAEKLEIHYTPKHGSWSGALCVMAEIEPYVLARQCLGHGCRVGRS